MYGGTTWTLTKYLESKARWGLCKDTMSCIEDIILVVSKLYRRHPIRSYTATSLPSGTPSKKSLLCRVEYTECISAEG